MMNPRETILIAESQIKIFDRPSSDVSKQLIHELKKSLKIIELMELKFKSGNNIDVERIVITRKELLDIRDTVVSLD